MYEPPKSIKFLRERLEEKGYQEFKGRLPEFYYPIITGTWGWFYHGILPSSNSHAFIFRTEEPLIHLVFFQGDPNEIIHRTETTFVSYTERLTPTKIVSGKFKKIEQSDTKKNSFEFTGKIIDFSFALSKDPRRDLYFDDKLGQTLRQIRIGEKHSNPV